MSFYILITIVAFIATGLGYTLGYGEGDNVRKALSDELRAVKAKLASITDRDEKGRFVRKEP